MKITIETHYLKSEPNSDYTDVVVKVNDEIVVTYGDGQHGKGRYKALGFVDGFKCGLLANMIIPFSIEEVDVDDR